MQHFSFGRNNGLRVSALALGAGTFGTRWGYGADADTARQIFDSFADAGGTFIDTAASYQVGESEEILGHLLAGRRDQFTVATKFAIGGAEGTGVLQTGNGRRAMFRSVEASLRRLGTDYIDLLWVHFPDFVTPIDEIVRAVDDLARTVAQLDSYVASLNVELGAEIYERLDAVSRIDLGQPHHQNAANRSATLGGDLDGFRRGPLPSA